MNSRTQIASACLTLLVASGCAVLRPEAPREARPADPASVRVIGSGEVVGLTGAYGAHVWLGLPFAQPPVGDLRWRAPLPPDGWTGTREALSFAPACTQFASPLGGVTDARPGEIEGEEDCLYLNVYAPRRAPGEVPTGGERLPVMLWIHGGGNTIGTASFYDAGRLAQAHDLVVVTTQYRLGPLGWFRHPALGGSEADRSGNYGMLDLIRALQWVRENISAFGGDPERVTIFGESAGGTNVLTLLLSPLARGLFHGAILQSPGTGTASIADAENYADSPNAGHPRSSREVLLTLLVRDGLAPDRAAARTYARGLGTDGVAAYLRGRPVREILEAYTPDSGEGAGEVDLPRIFRDGYVLPLEEPMERLARADGYNAVPVILGTNRDENKLFMYADPAEVRQVLGLLPRVRDRERYNMRSHYRARLWKATGVDEPATALRRVQGPSVYAYRFDWDEEPTVLGADLSVLLGASHAFEIPFVFGHFDLGPNGNVLFDAANEAGRRELSERMMSYWAQFAYTGDPGRGRSGTLPRWEAWSNEPGEPTFLVLDTDADGGVRMAYDRVTRAGLIGEIGADPRFASSGERCELLDLLAEWWGEFGARESASLGCRMPDVAGSPGD